MAVSQAGVSARADGSRPLRSYAFWAVNYRRTWRGSAVTTVLIPVLTLLALGYGLGRLLGSEGVAGLAYPLFLGPGLLAAGAMQTAMDDALFPVMGAVRWNRTYHAMLATPLTSRDVFVGHLLWVVTRVLAGSTAFLLALVAFGLVRSWEGLLVLPFAGLIGLAFAAPAMGFAARSRNSEDFALVYRFGVVPMFLFAGAFFPVSQLPGWLQPVAWVTPLWHGVSLCRAATLGLLQPWPALGHVAYLLLWAGAGVLVSDRVYRRVLVR